MTEQGFVLFDTAIGRPALAWGVGGIVGVQLPEADDAATRTRIGRRFPNARECEPPLKVRRAIDEIVALLAGEPRDLWAVVLDMEGIPFFDRRVYAIARTIPPGETTTYGEIAARLDDAGAARAVGAALGRNPFAIVVPCHRVLAANGKPGGFSAHGGILTKLQMLTIERARTGGAPMLFADLPLMAAPAGRRASGSRT